MWICARLATDNGERTHLIQHMSGRRLTALLFRLKPPAKGVQFALLTTLVLLMSIPQACADLPSAGLDPGCQRLYGLDFTGGQQEVWFAAKLKPTITMRSD